MKNSSCHYHPRKVISKYCAFCGKTLCRSCSLKTIVSASDVRVYEHAPYAPVGSGEYKFTVLKRNNKVVCPDCFMDRALFTRPRLIHWVLLIGITVLLLFVLQLASALDTVVFDLPLISGFLGLIVYWILYIKESLGFRSFKHQQSYAKSITGKSFKGTEVSFSEVILRGVPGFMASGLLFVAGIFIAAGILLGQSIETLQLIELLSVQGLFFVFVPLFVLGVLFHWRHGIVHFFNSLMTGKDSYAREKIQEMICYLIALFILAIVMIIIMA